MPGMPKRRAREAAERRWMEERKQGKLPFDEVFKLAEAVDPSSLESPMVKAEREGRLTRLRQRGIPDAPAPMLAHEGFDYWTELIRQRCEQHYDAVVLMTGPVGSGKSTGSMRMAQALDPSFTLKGRLCYTAASLMETYRTIKPGQVVLFDEGVRGLLAGDQASTEQKALVQALALIREKGAVLFVCAPSIWLVAKQIRQGRATLWIHVVERGVGLIHERNDRLRYVPDQTLGFSRSEACPYLLWDAYEPEDPFWLEYQAEKTKRLDEYLAETEALLRGGKKPKEGGAPAPPNAPKSPPEAPANPVEDPKERAKRLARERQRKHRDSQRDMATSVTGDRDTVSLLS